MKPREILYEIAAINAYAILHNMYSLLMLSRYQIQRHCVPVVSVEMKNWPYNDIKANVIFIKHALVYNAREWMYWIVLHPIIALCYTSITRKWSAKYDQHKCEELFQPGKSIKFTSVGNSWHCNVNFGV